MDLQDKIERDLKTALLAGDKKTTETLKGLKSAIQYEAVNLKLPKEQMSEEQLLKVLSREAKKRQEAAELYEKLGDAVRAEAEAAEKKIINNYLPQQLSAKEIEAVVEEEVARLDSPNQNDIGKIIGAVKGRLGAQADGSVIARIAKEKLESR